MPNTFKKEIEMKEFLFIDQSGETYSYEAKNIKEAILKHFDYVIEKDEVERTAIIDSNSSLQAINLFNKFCWNDNEEIKFIFDMKYASYNDGQYWED